MNRESTVNILVLFLILFLKYQLSLRRQSYDCFLLKYSFKFSSRSILLNKNKKIQSKFYKKKNP